MKLEVGGRGKDHQPDGVRVDDLEDFEVLPAEVLLPLELGLVHVLDEVTLRPPVHLHQLVLTGHHVVMVGVQEAGVLLNKLLTVINTGLGSQHLLKKNLIKQLSMHIKQDEVF